eukprot:2066529-Prorocentrum_lima.AAC.1
MTSSLVGSEMCIRDRNKQRGTAARRAVASPLRPYLQKSLGKQVTRPLRSCLLYTSDAADDM